MIENKHLRTGHFSGLPQSFTSHTIDEACDLTMFLYRAGKFPDLLLGLEMAGYGLRSAHPDLTTLA